MSLAPPGGFSWLSLTRSASAGGQLEHPSDVNNSTTTGVCAQAPKAETRRSGTNKRQDIFILHNETRAPDESFRLGGGMFAPELRQMTGCQWAVDSRYQWRQDTSSAAVVAW